MKNFVFMLNLILVVLFVQCKKEENHTDSKLKKITYHFPHTHRIGEIAVLYDGRRITQVGSSTFQYNAQGRVDKEIIRIKNSPESLTGEDIELTYQYTYNVQGQLIDVELTTDLSQTSLMPTAIAIPPDRKFTYEESRISRMESFTKANGLRILTDYIYNEGRLEFVTVERQYNSNTVLTPLESYDYWTGGPTYPNAVVPQTEKSVQYTYSINTSNQKNYLAEAFKSLGFIPLEINFYPFDVSFLATSVSSYTPLPPEDEIFTDSLFPYFGSTFIFDLNGDGHLERITSKTPMGVLVSEMKFVY